VLPVVILYLAVVNGLTVLLFRHDKRCAVLGLRRIRESHLLTLALLGGTPGALLARQWFRHKTRKQPFSMLLLMTAAIHVGLVAALVF
jgi:uncharacterized membrane protein YsdA (DUF1294 family)